MVTYYYYGDYSDFNHLVEKRCNRDYRRLSTDLKLMYTYGLIACQSQRYNEAETIIVDVMEKEKEYTFGMGHFIHCCMLLGEGYREIGNYEKSLTILSRAENLIKRIYYDIPEQRPQFTTRWDFRTA